MRDEKLTVGKISFSPYPTPPRNVDNTREARLERLCTEQQKTIDKLNKVVEAAINLSNDENSRTSEYWLDLGRSISELNTGQCLHNWVSADNHIVSGAEVCTKCHWIRKAELN